ncbi:unnamed protein product [Clonostachys rhizophaga]|uniref:Pyridoxamine 5'-phosphate oxidase N-terminal domain-containing protein n=1 Tax=Clonostachys rhizophaga TaxID=160324 RepID=A0A9N9YPG8_9HYPO|nr:unnamed protein product [Clonostachys rhizophaga]
MGVFYETIPATLSPWILKQRMFWVATAPLSGSGHVNVSPKGGEYFGLLDDKTFWFLELTGSGCETLSHLHETGNRRITIMLTAFEGAPKIVRLWGKGRVLENKTPEFESFVRDQSVKVIPGARSIILVDIHQVGTSCGFSVPLYEFKAHRDTLNEYYRKKDEKFRGGNEKESMDLYWAQNSQFSMDGLPAMKRARVIGEQQNVAQKKKMIGPLAPKNLRSRAQFPSKSTVFIIISSFILGVLFSLLAETIKARAYDFGQLARGRGSNSSANWAEL